GWGGRAGEEEGRRGTGAYWRGDSSACRRPGGGSCCKPQCRALRTRWAPPPRRQRGLINVRFAPKATEVLRCRKASLCAKSGREQMQQCEAKITRLPRRQWAHAPLVR